MLPGDARPDIEAERIASAPRDSRPAGRAAVSGVEAGVEEMFRPPDLGNLAEYKRAAALDEPIGPGQRQDSTRARLVVRSTALPVEDHDGRVPRRSNERARRLRRASSIPRAVAVRSDSLERDECAGLPLTAVSARYCATPCSHPSCDDDDRAHSGWHTPRCRARRDFRSELATTRQMGHGGAARLNRCSDALGDDRRAIPVCTTRNGSAPHGPSDRDTRNAADDVIRVCEGIPLERRAREFAENFGGFALRSLR